MDDSFRVAYAKMLLYLTVTMARHENRSAIHLLPLWACDEIIVEA